MIRRVSLVALTLCLAAFSSGCCCYPTLCWKRIKCHDEHAAGGVYCGPSCGEKYSGDCHGCKTPDPCDNCGQFTGHQPEYQQAHGSAMHVSHSEGDCASCGH